MCVFVDENFRIPTLHPAVLFFLSHSFLIPEIATSLSNLICGVAESGLGCLQFLAISCFCAVKVLSNDSCGSQLLLSTAGLVKHPDVLF